MCCRYSTTIAPASRTLNNPAVLCCQTAQNPHYLSTIHPQTPTNVLNLRYSSILLTNLLIANDGETNIRWTSIHVRPVLKHWCIPRQARRMPLPVPEALACTSSDAHAPQLRGSTVVETCRSLNGDVVGFTCRDCLWERSASSTRTMDGM